MLSSTSSPTNEEQNRDKSRNSKPDLLLSSSISESNVNSSLSKSLTSSEAKDRQIAQQNQNFIETHDKMNRYSIKGVAMPIQTVGTITDSEDD